MNWRLGSTPSGIRHGSFCWLLGAAVMAGCTTPVAPRSQSAKPGTTPATSGAGKKRSEAALPSASRLRVNKETVEARDVWRGIRADFAARAQRVPPSEIRAWVERESAALINDRIAEMLLYQQASLRTESHESDAIHRFVDERIRKTVVEEYGGSLRRYERFLESQGETLDEARRRLHRELVIARFLELEVRPKVSEPTRPELWEAFQQTADSLRRVPRRRMSLIDVRVLDRLTPDIDQPTRDQLAEARIAARARIEAAELELRDGVGFADVARKYSDGLAAQEGGSWGWVTPGSVRKRFEPAVEKLYELDEGAVSDILEVDDGFFLVRCDEIDPGVEPDFQSVQPQLREQLIRIRYNRLIAERVNELRAVARIEPEDLGPFHDAVVAAAPSPESPP